jgi:NTP pyrophosphatase (non-canonical NTP hydrolase)
MTFTTYQQQAMRTCLPQSANLDYMILGLASEVGEVAGKLKKILRDTTPGTTPDLVPLASELGDVLWYTVGLLHVSKLTPKDVANDLEELTIAEFEHQCLNREGDIGLNMPLTVAPLARLTALVKYIVIATGDIAGAEEDFPEDQDQALDRVNDVWQFLAEAAHAIGVPLHVIARQNLEKLADRQQRAALQGSGDHR